VNEEWISDKTRYCVDGLGVQRLDQPYVRVDGRLKAASWPEAFDAIAKRVAATSGAKIGALAGDLASVEEIYALKLLMQALGSESMDCRQDGVALDPSLGRASYIFNATVAGIESADAVLIVGSNPRKEAPVLNARIRKRWRMGGLPVGVIGESANLTYTYEHLGAGPDTLARLVAGNSFFETLKAAQRPLIIVGQGALSGENGAAILSAVAKLAVDVGAVTESWNGFSVLHTAAARVGGLDVGFVPGQHGAGAREIVSGAAKLDVLFLLGVDEVAIPDGPFVAYIGTHGDQGAHRADVILPGSTYTEKSATYVNTEGRVQMGNRAAFPPGDAREDWAILRALSGVLSKTLPFDSLSQLRAHLHKPYPHLAEVDQIKSGAHGDIERVAARGGAVAGPAFASPIRDFYLTNPIARASQVLAECSAMHLGPTAEAAE
jgi:NADH-quinone oxidoreductase subunit G